MGKKGHNKDGKKKLTKKEKKAQAHLKLMQGKKGSELSSGNDYHDQNKKAA